MGVNVRADGRLGPQLGDTYGSRFGPTTAQLGSARMAAGSPLPPSTSAPVVVDKHEAIAGFFLTTPAGVALLVAAGLIVLSLSD